MKLSVLRNLNDQTLFQVFDVSSQINEVFTEKLGMEKKVMFDCISESVVFFNWLGFMTF